MSERQVVIEHVIESHELVKQGETHPNTRGETDQVVPVAAT